MAYPRGDPNKADFLPSTMDEDVSEWDFMKYPEFSSIEESPPWHPMHRQIAANYTAPFNTPARPGNAMTPSSLSTLNAKATPFTPRAVFPPAGSVSMPPASSQNMKNASKNAPRPTALPNPTVTRLNVPQPSNQPQPFHFEPHLMKELPPANGPRPIYGPQPTNFRPHFADTLPLAVPDTVSNLRNTLHPGMRKADGSVVVDIFWAAECIGVEHLQYSQGTGRFVLKRMSGVRTVGTNYGIPQMIIDWLLEEGGFGGMTLVVPKKIADEFW